MKDFTIRDSTQIAAIRHLAITENLLARAASKASGTEQTAQIILMPDLGMPYNVRRIHGGFFTGALYTWQTTVPIVPVDGTVNVCRTSLFRLSKDINTQEEFLNLLSDAIRRTERMSSYVWNFAAGNHFILYGEINGRGDIPDGKYALLHSSAAEYKKQIEGLYPIKGNWYWDEIKTLHGDSDNRYLRYIEGQTAERFIRLAQRLEDFQRARHNFFAELIFGKMLDSEVMSADHYGMPTPNSIAIGCHWNDNDNVVPMLTAPGLPVYLVKPLEGFQNQLSIDGRSLVLTPHGLGVKWTGPLNIKYLSNCLLIDDKKYSFECSLANDKNIQIRSFSPDECSGGNIPQMVLDALKQCPSAIVATFSPIYSYDSQSSFNHNNLKELTNFKKVPEPIMPK